jgi:hypothetical protein
MLNFVARVFRGWMNAVLWLILIGFAIGGFVAGGVILGGGWGFNGGYAFLGLLLGGFIGLITVILSGGLIANFLNMVDNTEKQTAILMHIYGNDIPKDVINKIVSKKETTTDKISEPEIVTSSTPLANNQIKIIRLEAVVGSALLVDVNVDNQNFQLENGEVKIVNLENGKHIISTSFNNDYEELEFVLNNDNKTFNVFIKPPIKIQEV